MSREYHGGMKVLLRENYFATIRESVGSRFFRHLYVQDGSGQRDAARAGRLSCGLFVSILLHRFNLVKNVHATVSGTLKDMENSGWKRVRTPKSGDIIVWEPIKEFGEIHRHIGFFMGNGHAISNSSKRRVPIRHHWTFGTKKGVPRRKIESIYRHPKLAQ